MGKIVFENRTYDFTWKGLLFLAIGGPILSLLIYYSNDYVWLHEITAKITVYTLNLITGLNSQVVYSEYTGYWYILMENADRTQYLPRIQFTTFCTGIQAIAIFVGVIVFIPHTTIPETNKDIWPRKVRAMVECSLLFYVVNIIRMWIQLYLYHIGYEWDSIHYPISAASSFIAIAAILLMHKRVPEFIMSLIWMGDQLRIKIKGNPQNLNPAPVLSIAEGKNGSKLEAEIKTMPNNEKKN
jgi:exosortase/archaeosortase family protein